MKTPAKLKQESRWVESDVVYTPDHIAEWIVNYFKPQGLCLDPCKGGGAFYNKFPGEKDWCEIRDGRNFFDHTTKAIWIITNPPFTNIERFMEHSFSLADNVVFLLPAHKTFSSWARIRLIEAYGGIVTILLVKGQQCQFPFRYPYGVFHFQKGYNGGTLIQNCEA